MHHLLAELASDLPLSGVLSKDVTAFLILHDLPKTARHSGQVADEAHKIAGLFGADTSQAEAAGWLHDISAVFPPGSRVEVARQLGLEVLPEELALPMIIHQKISMVMAQDIFGITNKAVLSAIGCHTTLKANASLLDKIVFVADKIQWDQAGEPPYLRHLLAALERSVDEAAWCYLDYFWQRRDTLPVIHPWLVEAHRQLANSFSSSPPGNTP